jgi:glycerol uptake facilitator protein
MHSAFFGEFMGTLVLVLVGNGVVANVVLKKTLGENSGWIVICTGYGLGVMAGVFTAIACGSSGAHINPAVTLGMAIAQNDFSNVATFIPAQILGAMTGALLVWLHFKPHWALTPDQGSKLACFSTGPAVKSTGWNIFSETLGTFLLVAIIGSIFSKSVSLSGPAPGVGPFLVGATVWAIGLGLGGTTGFAINPARDLGPRIMHAILPIPGKGGSNWGYAMVPVIGGIIGGALAGVFLKLHVQ